MCPENSERGDRDGPLEETSAESLAVVAGGLAHDFNNILAAIIGNIELAQMSLHSFDVPQARLALVDAEHAALRARNLTQQLLNFSSRIEPEKKPISLEAIAYEAVTFALSASRHRCMVEVAEPIWTVDADSAQISQVITNLLLNADQSMADPGVITLKIENVMVEKGYNLPLPEGPSVRVSISDQGPPVRPEVAARMFEPFFSTKQRRSGLGLASAYSVIRAHGGHIYVDTSTGSGAAFVFYLPADVRVQPNAQASKAQRFHGATGPLRILVMDDEEMLRDMLQQTLTALGHTVITAADGREALAEYEIGLKAGHRFDLAILDLTVPGGMGGELAIKSLLELDPQACAIATSGYANDPIMIDCQKFGFRAKLTKPYSIAELQRTLYVIFQDRALSAREEVQRHEAHHH